MEVLRVVKKITDIMDSTMISFVFDDIEEYEASTPLSPWNEEKRCYDINLAYILNLLIRDAGRYCDLSAGDLFDHWKDVILPYLSTRKEGGSERVFLIGFHKCGVVVTSTSDHDAVESFSRAVKYRKIVGLRFRTNYCNRDQMFATLKDMTDVFEEITD